jgi:hypothetical protein
MTTPDGKGDARRAGETDQLTWAEVAEMAKLPVQTLRTYRLRGALPEPDGYLVPRQATFARNEIARSASSSV